MNSIWTNCYKDTWKGFIVDEAFSHPAKFSHALIGKIYAHALDKGWVKQGDAVLDPFGGVALGALPALVNGLHWVGVELEPRFVALGQQNIDLWLRKFRFWPHMGTARIIQGDSRRIGAVVKEAGLIVSSPPFMAQERGSGLAKPEATYIGDGHKFGANHGYQNQAFTPGNLANMKEGDISAVIGSPPFSSQNTGGGIAKSIDGKSNYPVWDGLARGKKAGRSSHGLGYQNQGETPGQLGSMHEGEFDACISSPPYEHRSYEGMSVSFAEWREMEGRDNSKPGVQAVVNGYGKAEGQLAGSSTFWEASKEIVRGCHALLKPGGHAIWVTKDYVKAGKVVPFSDRWQALCESVGFKVVCRHQAMLVEHHGAQMTTDMGIEEIRTEKKSFFRRLAEKKGSPRIDYESVICMEK